MSIFNRFKKKEEEQKLEQRGAGKVSDEKKEQAQKVEKAAPKKAEVKKTEKKVEKKSSEKKDIKGGTTQAYRVLVKPLITEKATELAGMNKYVFAVDPTMNKVEIKKAIRSIYEVEPVDVNIISVKGKRVRFGRVRGQRSNWKKAVITLQQGDTIQVYEGV